MHVKKNWFNQLTLFSAGRFIKALSKNTTILNDLGLHARPAAGIAKIAQDAKSNVWLIKDDTKVDAGSIIDILTLACGKGTEITLQVEDNSDAAILTRIIDYIETGFGE